MQIYIEDVGFVEGDTGCQTATNFIGHQSECLNCPFKDCVQDNTEARSRGIYEKSKRRNTLILEDYKAGIPLQEIATKNNLSLDRTSRIIRSLR